MAGIRNIIEIDEELCNGCGQCILDCAEGALELVDGKARLVGEIYCDGLGACLSGCPTGALTVIQREADEFDEHAVEKRLDSLKKSHVESAPQDIELMPPMACGCPSSHSTTLKPGEAGQTGQQASTLGHWPIKLQLLSPQAPFLKNADLLLLADCAAASLPDLHGRFLPGKAVALACPKLDDAQAHIDKLAEVLKGSDPKSLTVVHMEVPCCKGLEFIAQKAMEASGVVPSVGSIVVGRDGKILHCRNAPWCEQG